MKTCSQCKRSFEDTALFCPHDGEVLMESPSDMVGQVLDGQYEIEHFIAQGGMGAVYRARHILLGDRVVVKTLRSEMRQNSEWLRRFQREGQAARRFRHPNAVTVYDLRTSGDGLIYMVMEYVEGRTLDRELKERGRLTPREALEVLTPVADVLDAAHSTGVVHRDLKPENVMIENPSEGRPGRVKVLDLGIAKMLGKGDAHSGEATSLTVAGQLLGTPYYMSPEQWGELPRDGGGEVDGRSDIYSLGLILYEAVAGRKPFQAGSLAELRHKHVSVPAEPLDAVAPGVPEAFGRAVARAIAKDRGDRHATAGELVRELRVALENSPALAADATAALPYAGGHTQEDARRGAATNDFAGRTGAGQVPHTTSSVAPPTHTSNVGAAASSTAAESIATLSAGPHSLTSAGARETGAQAALTSADSSGVARTHADAPPARRRSAGVPILIGAVVLLLTLAVAGVGGWFAWSRMRAAKIQEDGANVGAQQEAGATVSGEKENTAENAPPGETSEAAQVEVMRYWLVYYSPKGGEGMTLASSLPTLHSDQQFQLHFAPKESGYLYLFAREGDGPTTALLTSRPAQLKSNRVEADTDLVFPPGRNVLQLDKGEGTEVLTVVFSPQQLTGPAALASEVGRELKPEEQQELDEFVGQHKAQESQIESKGFSEGEPYMSVTRDASGAEVRPLVFEIRIKHM